MYMVYIENAGNPKKKHDTFEEANIELERILMQPSSVGKIGYVFKVETIKKSVQIVKEIGDIK
jgi:predicted Zn-ribbon and HTH transcriptional regulator